MKALGWIAATLLLGSGCMTTRGTGGSGLALDEAHDACVRAANARGWDDLGRLEEMKVTGRHTAQLTFDRSGFLKRDATCYFNDRTNAASID